MMEKIFKELKEHKPIIVNYGKGTITNKETKEMAYWNEEKQKYVSETGIWGNKLLRQIARGEIENMSIEVFA